VTRRRRRYPESAEAFAKGDVPLKVQLFDKASETVFYEYIDDLPQALRTTVGLAERKRAHGMVREIVAAPGSPPGPGRNRRRRKRVGLPCSGKEIGVGGLKKIRNTDEGRRR
jgi:hypothetical protein